MYFNVIADDFGKNKILFIKKENAEEEITKITKDIEKIIISYCQKEYSDWISKTEQKIRYLKEIKTIILERYASQIIIKLAPEKVVNILFILCEENKEVEWVEKERTFIIENIINIELHKYASRIITKLRFSFCEKNKLVINCDNKNQIEWLNENTRKEINFQNIKCLEFFEIARKIIINSV